MLGIGGKAVWDSSSKPGTPATPVSAYEGWYFCLTLLHMCRNSPKTLFLL